MSNYRVLFVTQRGQRHQRAALDAAPDGLDVVIRRSPSREEIIALVRDMDFLISERSGTIDRDVIAAGSKLKLIQRLGTQIWDIDLDAAKRAGIPVCAMPVRTCILVAEHMLMLMLALARHFRDLVRVTDEARDWDMPPKRCNEDYFAFNWSGRKEIGGLQGVTVGLLGYGEIATELARRLKNFGCTVLYNKRRRLPPQAEAELNIAYAARDELAARSDFIGCLLPNLPELNQSVDGAFFAQVKRGAMFVHCGAPGVVNELALLDALRAGRLGGAALDCFTYEPLRPDDPLLELARDPAANLILTPHVAAGTVAASREERIGDYRNIMAVIGGGELQGRLA
jgi:phosphoglycerate dehydrogenase-like enzyme